MSRKPRQYIERRLHQYALQRGSAHLPPLSKETLRHIERMMLDCYITGRHQGRLQGLEQVKRMTAHAYHQYLDQNVRSAGDTDEDIS